MNIKRQIKKLQTALSIKGRIIRINSYQFYSEQQGRMIDCYSLVEKQWRLNKKGKSVLKDVELLNTCSKIKVLQFLAEEYKQIQTEGNDGETNTEAESLC